MLPALDHLIRLQNLHDAAEDARQRLAAIPAKLEAQQAHLAEHRQAVTAARQRLEHTNEARRAIEQQLGIAQNRLSKFKDQLMAVKTNREYQAMLKEIAAAEHEVHAFEDRILNLLLDADVHASAVARAEQSFTAEQDAVATEQRTIEEGRVRLEHELKRTSDVRESLVAQIAPDALELFEHIARQRRGVAVVEARDGLCTACHVRLRPQVFNEVRRNDSLIQCESCNRILHFNAWSGVESSTQV